MSLTAEQRAWIRCERDRIAIPWHRDRPQIHLWRVVDETIVMVVTRASHARFHAKQPAFPPGRTTHDRR